MIMTVILGLIIIGLLGFVFWQNFMQPKTETNKKDDSSVIKPDVKTPVVSKPMADWKIYSASTPFPNIGFSIKYPEGWTASVDDSSYPSYSIDSSDYQYQIDSNGYFYLTSGASLVVSFMPSDGLTLKDFVKRVAWVDSIDLVDSMLAGTTAFSGSKTNDPKDSKRYSIWTIKDDVVVQVQMMFPYDSPNSTDLKQIFDNAISTFKFLN